MLDTNGQRPFIAYAPVQTDKTMESMAELKRELTEYLGDNPATDEELEKVKDNATLSLPGRWETSAAVLQDIGQIVTYDLPDDYWDTYAQNVRGLSLEPDQLSGRPGHQARQPGLGGGRRSRKDRIRNSRARMG